MTRSALTQTARRVGRAAPAVVVVLGVAVSLVVGVVQLRDVADDRAQARVLLAQLQSETVRAELLGCERTSTETVCRGGQERSLDLGERLAGLVGQERTTALWMSLDPAAETDPARTRQIADQLSNDLSRDADLASLLADVGTVLLTALAVITMVSLIRRSDAARRDGVLGAALERARTEARFRALADHGTDVILCVSEDLVVTYASPAAESLLGVVVGSAGTEAPRPALTGPPVRLPDLVAPVDGDALSTALVALLSGERGQVRRTLRWRRRGGGQVWLDAVVSDLRTNPNVGALVVNGHDVTAGLELQEQLRHQAFHDELTGLANRALFADRLEHRLARRTSGDPPAALLFLDLDGFKETNDALGHACGDQLIAAVARRLRGAIRPADTLARLGGDEFAVLVDDAGDRTPEQVAARMLNALRVVELDAGPRWQAGPVEASIGIAVTHGGGVDAEDLLRDADLAMYAAKAAGGGQWVRFEPKMREEMLDRATLRRDLALAADSGQLVVHYQPTVDLRTGAPLGLEALVRWEHPTRGRIAPSDFIPLAEETGDIVGIGQWVLRTACAQVQQWTGQGLLGQAGPLNLAVNLSAQQMIGSDLVSHVRDALIDTGLDPRQLTLEITESQLLVDAESAGSVLAQLRAMGVAIAVDDFGTGFSSLTYLQELPLDVLKIDRSFVQRLPSSTEAQVLVASIVAMAVALGLQVVAEGIEERAQAIALGEMSCAVGQGFLWARPVAADQLEQALRARVLPGGAWPTPEQTRVDQIVLPVT